MRVALVQLNIKWQAKETNYARAEKFIKMAAQQACQTVVLPEMFNTGFSMDVSAVAEEEAGETAAFLSEAAGKYGLNLIAGFAVRVKGEQKAKNMAVVYDRKGARIASFSKMYPFSFLKEDQYYIPGSDPVVFELAGMPCSVFICYDLRFPEIFRRVAPKVQAIFVIANWPAERKEHWEALLKARAIENQCFIIGVNRTGRDGNGLAYPGASHIFDPWGNTVCAGKEKEELVIGRITPAQVSEVRSSWPFLRDMHC